MVILKDLPFDKQFNKLIEHYKISKQTYITKTPNEYSFVIPDGEIKLQNTKPYSAEFSGYKSDNCYQIKFKKNLVLTPKNTPGYPAIIFDNYLIMHNGNLTYIPIKLSTSKLDFDFSVNINNDVMTMIFNINDVRYELDSIYNTENILKYFNLFDSELIHNILLLRNIDKHTEYILYFVNIFSPFGCRCDISFISYQSPSNFTYI